MRRKRLARLIIDQLLCISVICTDKHLAVHLADRLHCSSHAYIYCLDCLNRCLLYTGMTHHIRIRKVDDDHIILSRLDRLYQLIADLIGTHFRLQVIGGYLR